MGTNTRTAETPSTHRGRGGFQIATLREKAKAPTSPKVGALPFSLSSHKENRWEAY
jgi:hypothetical protein